MTSVIPSKPNRLMEKKLLGVKNFVDTLSSLPLLSGFHRSRTKISWMPVVEDHPLART
jgi:hypothetical protein